MRRVGGVCRAASLPGTVAPLGGVDAATSMNNVVLYFASSAYFPRATPPAPSLASTREVS